MIIVKKEYYEDINDVSDLDKVIYEIMNKYHGASWKIRLYRENNYDQEHDFYITKIEVEPDNCQIKIFID